MLQQKLTRFLHPGPQQGQDVGANLFLLRLGAGALVGELVILNLRFHRIGLAIQHHPPEAVRHAITMLDLVILNQGSGLGNSLRATDLVQSLGI